MRKNYFLSLFMLLTAFWQVQATDGSKPANPNGNTTPTNFFVAPNAPTGLVGTPVGGVGTRISLRWTDNSIDETEFEVAYSLLPTGYQSVLTGISNGSPLGTFTLSNLMPSSTYYIWVRAIRNGADVPPVCPMQTNMPTNPVPATKSGSCWSGGIVVSTNDNLAAAVTDVIVATPYSQRTNTVTFVDNSNNETGFIIERSTGGDFVILTTIPAIAGTGRRAYVDNTTLPNTAYRYRVSVRNATGVTLPEAVTGFFQTPPDPPVPASGLGTFDIGLNSIGLFWINNASDATGFLIQQSVDNNSWATIGTNDPGNRGFVARNLNEGQRYFFRIISFNSGGNATPSPVLAATTLKRVAPNPSTNLMAKTISTTQIDLNWNLGVQDNVTNNRIAQGVYRSSISATEGFVQIATLGDFEAAYSDKAAMPKTKYWYKILSANFQGESPFTNVATATTLGPPFAPSNLTTVLANDALGNAIIRATWKDNSNDEWGFTLERATDTLFTKDVLKANLDSNLVAATSVPIEEGLTYYFRVNASNRFGSSKYSNISQTETIVTVAPNAPYALKATTTAAEVTLRWGDDSNKEAAFDVERSDDGKVFAKIGSTTRNEVVFVDKTVKEKTKYFYRVRATNIKGNSDFSNIVEVTTLAKVSASIEMIDNNDMIQVYPNPTASSLKVSVTETIAKETGVIVITDRLNREISKVNLTSNQLEYNLDLNNYTEGTYTVSIRTATQQITKRVYKY